MRHLIFTAALMVSALPAFATTRAPDQPQLQVAGAQSCRDACRVQASRPGAIPATAQACFIRCGAGAELVREAPSAQPVFTGVGTPVSATRTAAAAMPVPQSGYGVIFAGRAPTSSYGLVVGETDRLVAHRIAEQTCSRAGPGCRVIAEFTATCGAVAQGVVRARGALFITSDPNTYVVTSISGGFAGNRADADADALAECRSKDSHGTCRVVAAQCGNRNS